MYSALTHCLDLLVQQDEVRPPVTMCSATRSSAPRTSRSFVTTYQTPYPCQGTSFVRAVPNFRVVCVIVRSSARACVYVWAKALVRASCVIVRARESAYVITRWRAFVSVLNRFCVFLYARASFLRPPKACCVIMRARSYVCAGVRAL